MFDAASPVPDEPSPESVRLLDRLRGNRKMQARIKPGKLSMHLYRLTLNAIGLAARPPKGGSVRKVRHGAHGRLVAGPAADPANGILMWCTAAR